MLYITEQTNISFNIYEWEILRAEVKKKLMRFKIKPNKK